MLIQRIECNLASPSSTRLSLQEIREGRAGLNGHRRSLLRKVPNTGDFSNFQLKSINYNDLAYLTAATGDEFALIEAKREYILFHGSTGNCVFSPEMLEMFASGKDKLLAHTHPGEEEPVASPEDVEFLRLIEQKTSVVISGRTGRYIEYKSEPFAI